MIARDPLTGQPGAPALLAEGLRDIHAAMVDAILSGDGMHEVAAIAGRRIGAPVAVLIPELGHELIEPPDEAPARLLGILGRYVDARLAGRRAQRPAPVTDEVAVRSGSSEHGLIMLLAPPRSAGEDAHAVLNLAAMAAMTELAMVEGRQRAEDELRGSFLEELRSGAQLEAADVLRRAGRLGTDLSRGAVVMVAAPDPSRVYRLTAGLRAECPGSFVQRLGDRVYAVLPAGEDEEGPDRAVALAGAVAERLRPQAPVAVSSFQANPAELGRAIAEADLILDVLGHSDVPPERLADGTYRLLLQLLASHPEQLRAYHERSVKPLSDYDEQYRTDLVGTLAAYLDHDARLGATAEALYAHRHTIAYRLERIRDLTGLDVARYEDRETLSLGLKAHRLIAGRVL